MTAADRKRIAELERRVRELEARPPQVVNYPVFTPYVPVQPVWPAPQPWPGYPWPIVTCEATKHYREDLPGTAVVIRFGDFSGDARTVFGQ